MTTLHRDGKILEEVVEIERHLHNREMWASAAAAPNGEVHVADIDVPTTLFQMDAGNNTWGTWLQVLGSADTPVQAGMVKYDAHEIFISTYQRANVVYLIQMGCGASGAGALTAGTYSTFPFQGPANARQAALPHFMRRCAVGEKLWMRCWARGEISGTMDFFVGFHEYEE